jgi:serine/threonine protein kinase
LGGTLSSQGLDRRILVKEYFGDMALQLADNELKALGKLQSSLLQRSGDESARKGDWIDAAASRSVKLRLDNANVATLVNLLRAEPYVGILGEINLAEFDDDLDANEFYRALSVPPPKSGAVWLVYEYAGLSSLQAYTSQPPEVRRSSLPPKRGFFGAIVRAPPLPSFEERANYVVKGIMKGAIEAVASLHESGLVHRSIGRSSFILSSKTMDKREVASPYATMVSQLCVKLADFGFSGLYKESANNEEFCARARTFGLSFRRGDNTVVTNNFAMAEDCHALGFVFLGLLLTALAELPSADTPMPATDEDSLQRLLGDIFEKDFEQFRAYIEAEDVWSKLVDLLDKNNGAGWSVLETLMLAREKAAKTKDSLQMFTIRGLLSNPFFAS